MGMETGWIIIFAVSIFVTSYLALYAYLRRREQGKGSQDGAGRRHVENLELFEVLSPFIESVKPLARLMMGTMSSKEIAELDQKLADAGLRHLIGLDEFMGFRLFSALAGAFLGLLILVAMSMHPMGLLAILLFAMIGWVYPNSWIHGLATVRQGKIFRGLSETLDVLAVSVSAGLELRDALAWVVQIGSEPLLDQEINRTIQEVDKGGKSLRQGFEDLRERVNMPEMTAFCNVVLMAFQLGASGMSAIFADQAEAIRKERIMRAERAANQMPSKILFPIALFIFPAVIVTLLGPMALEAYLQFGN